MAANEIIRIIFGNQTLSPDFLAIVYRRVPGTVIILPLGAEDLYEPKERLLINLVLRGRYN
jgi:hypothetical protein